MIRVSPPALAFFDFDRTLTCKDSGELIALRVGLRGLVQPRAGLRFLWKGLLYKFGRVTRAEMQAVGYATYTGAPMATLPATLDTLWDPCIAPDLAPTVLSRLRAHQDRGEPVYVLTASPDYVAAPAVRALGVTAVLGTTMEVAPNGRLTGGIDGPIFEGEEKAGAARRLAAEHGVDLDDCWAYSDSIADLPLLALVGHPVAVQPDRELRAVAEARGWEVLPHRRPGLLTVR